jgi:hypothetical protein
MAADKSRADRIPHHSRKETKGRKKCRAAAALKTILEIGPQLYCNILGMPSIRLPPPRAGPEQEEWPLQSGRVRAWIAETIWDKAGTVLLEREVNGLAFSPNSRAINLKSRSRNTSFSSVSG